MSASGTGTGSAEQTDSTERVGSAGRSGSAELFGSVGRSGSAGRIWGIIGLVLAALPPFQLFGLAASIAGLALSRRAGRPNGFAIAGIVVSVLLITAVVVLVVAFASAGFELFGDSVGTTVWVCTELGAGEHVVDGLRYTCT